MSTSTVTPIRPANAFETARLALIKKLLEIKSPDAFSVFPVPSQFTAIHHHVSEVTAICNEWLAAIGHEVADNSSSRVDLDLFRTAFSDAVDGMALWEIEKQAEALIEDHNEMIRERA